MDSKARPTVRSDQQVLHQEASVQREHAQCEKGLRGGLFRATRRNQAQRVYPLVQHEEGLQAYLQLARSSDGEQAPCEEEVCKAKALT
jgi:hypothetical protein